MKRPTIRLTKLEREMVLRAIGFVDAGEWPWEPYKKAEGRALNSAWKKISAADDEAEGGAADSRGPSNG